MNENDKKVRVLFLILLAMLLILGSIVVLASDYPDLELYVVGYTDSKSCFEYNMDLSTA